MFISMRFALIVFNIFIQIFWSNTIISLVSIGGASNDVSYNTTTDNLGNVYNTGYFRNFADFDPGSSTTKFKWSYRCFYSKTKYQWRFIQDLGVT